jgi:plastocyanin
MGVAAFLVAFVAHAQTLNLPAGTQGTAYSYSLSGAPAGSVYSATGLPGGLSIGAATGTVSGTPNASGTFNGTITVAAGSVTNNYSFALVINPPSGTPVVSSGAVASGTVNVNNATIYTIAASNTPTSFNASGLPPGLTLNTTSGVIGGTPTAAGTYLASVSANNASGLGASKTVTFTIAAGANTPVISSSATLVASAAGSAITPYQITASNGPILSYSATGLPAGLTLDTGTGVITGTPAAGGISTVTLRATNASGAGAAFTLTITVGTLPTISSATTASGTVGSSFSYAVTGTPTTGVNAITSYTVGTLPPGLSLGGTATAPTITGTPSTAGTYNVSLAANNVNGTSATTTLTITIASAPPSGGGGGGGIPVVAAPSITTQPASQTVTRGSSVTFTVSATSSGLNYQWSKNGVVITGAQQSSYTIASAQDSDAGSYTVLVSNSGGSATSTAAVLTVVPPAVVTAPVITAQPASQSVTVGTTVTFAVTASGSAPLTYQWRKDGVAISGATASSLMLPVVGTNAAGGYSVVVSNSAGSVTSNTATLAVSRILAGAYFGSFGNNAGTFALLVRSDGTGVFLGYLSTERRALVATNVTIDANGNVSASFPSFINPLGPVAAGTPAIAASHDGYHLNGSLAATGGFSGTVSGLNLSLSAPAATAAGTTSSLAGYYPAGVPNSSAASYTIVGAGGDAFVLTTSGATADAGRGTITPAGALTVTTAANTAVTGAVTASGYSLTSGTSTFVGRNADAAVDFEKLVNISTRSQALTGGDIMIAGFVITGTQPKPVLIRGIGPTLTGFGVGGALSAVRLEVFRGQTSIAVGNDWAAGGNAATLAATAVRVGAFALANNSRDAALLLTLQPGNYTVQVSGQGGATGVALVEAYDATEGTIPNAQRIINISTRAIAGSGDTALIAGFYINGTVPKRVLIRGVGPSLTQFGVTGALARPQLAIYSGQTVVAQNAGWTTSADSTAIATGSTQVGAFTFLPGSQDAALILNLAPGAYSAQVTGVNNTTGVALVEVYELP